MSDIKRKQLSNLLIVGNFVKAQCLRLGWATNFPQTVLAL